MFKFPDPEPESDPIPDPVIEWDVEVDSHLVVRETPAWKVREQWAMVQHAHLQNELQIAHEEDHSHDEIVPLPAPRRLTWIERKLDEYGVWICQHFHPLPRYIRGEDFSTCPSCHRRYGAPWADPSKLDADVYVNDEPFVASKEFTRQAI